MLEEIVNIIDYVALHGNAIMFKNRIDIVWSLLGSVDMGLRRAKFLVG